MPIDPDQVEAVFAEAIGLTDAGARSAFLDRACGGNAELRGRVEALLAAHDESSSFLTLKLDSGATAPFAPLSERPGVTIGRYKLLEQIGEGGFGVVFMAEQKIPVIRKVALKIIKPGMDSRQVIARFDAERQALALMDHPNIARVLDAGVTDSGRPFFVMDLVKGVPITDYCDQRHLSVRQRLQLMIAVCQAVQHAHQKGVIHRDLKPANVLVAEYDGRPVPKVIDFGVAKATGGQLTERTLFTLYGQIVGTFEYMSPEQARFNQLEVDTRSDIYSLGVLLYELLTGSTPLEKERLRTAAFDEVLRIIGEEEPPRPSARLSSSQSLPSIAANRNLEPSKLSSLLRAELDWIVMKAIEKDRGRRYETANALLHDVENYLAGESVLACPPSMMYRCRKFVRRNTGVVMAGAAIVGALIAGLTIASMGLIHARREAAKATAISDLLLQMLQSATPLAAKGPEYTVREMLNEFAARLDDQLRGQPEVEATIRATIGTALESLGAPDEAEPHLRGALNLRREIFGEVHAAVARSNCECAWLAMHSNRFTEAEDFARKALAIYEQLELEDGATVESLSVLGLSLANQVRDREAESIYQRASELARKHGLTAQLAQILKQRAIHVHVMGDARLAERLARESLELTRELYGAHSVHSSSALEGLAIILMKRGNLDEAEKCYREAIAICRDELGDAHNAIRTLRYELRTVLMFKADQTALAALDAELASSEAAALAECDKAIAAHPYSPLRLTQRANIYAMRGEFDRAQSDLARAAELAPENGEITKLSAMVCLARNDDAGFRQASKKFADQAVHKFERSAARFAVLLYIVTPDSDIEAAQAVELAERAVEAGPRWGDVIGLLGATLYRAGRYDEAAQKFDEATAVEEAAGRHAYPEEQAYGYLLQAMLNHRLGNLQKAKEFLDRAAQIIDGQPRHTPLWPYSMFLQRLRNEAESLLGVEPKTATLSCRKDMIGRHRGDNPYECRASREPKVIVSLPSTRGRAGEFDSPTACCGLQLANL